MKITFDKESCPRCHHPWIKSERSMGRCESDCGMKMWHSGMGMVVSLKLHLRKFIVIWQTNGECYYYRYYNKNLSNNEMIHLGWLPFDITDEQIDLFSTFS